MRSFVFTSVLALVLSQAAFAQHGGHEQDYPALYPKKPATRYSGGTPVDLSNGLTGNNGTYGNPNADYESWAKARNIVAGVSEQPYSYRQRGEFVRALKEQIAWGEIALSNWKSTSKTTRAEAVEYSKQAAAKMSPALENLKKAVDRADGAGEKDWTNSEAEARRALIDFRAAYMQTHQNTQWLGHRAKVEN